MLITELMKLIEGNHKKQGGGFWRNLPNTGDDKDDKGYDCP